MQTFVQNTKTSRNILRKASGKALSSSINHTKVIKKKDRPSAAAASQRVYPSTGSGSSIICTLPTAGAGIHKATKQNRPGKADLRDKSKLTLCTVCGNFVTKGSKELSVHYLFTTIHSHAPQQKCISMNNQRRTVTMPKNKLHL